MVAQHLETTTTEEKQNIGKKGMKEPKLLKIKYIFKTICVDNKLQS